MLMYSQAHQVASTAGNCCSRRVAAIKRYAETLASYSDCMPRTDVLDARVQRDEVLSLLSLLALPVQKVQILASCSDCMHKTDVLHARVQRDEVLKFTCFTSTKVQVLTSEERDQVISLLALLVQKYKY
jgi:hypothetical protein